jgi:hypothetical protein
MKSKYSRQRWISSCQRNVGGIFYFYDYRYRSYDFFFFVMASVSGASVQLCDWNRLVSISPFNLLGLSFLADYVRLSLYLFHGPSEDRPVPVRVLQLETAPIGL